MCDVPCTGDGAIRKAPELWRYWQPHLGRHVLEEARLQHVRVRVAQRLVGAVRHCWASAASVVLGGIRQV